MKWDWKAVLGIAISLVLIWWVLRGVDSAEVWASVRTARWGLLVAAVAVATFGFAIRAMRWKLLLHPLRPGIGFRPRFAAVNIGFAANNLLPARVGEFARAWAISRLEPVTATGALGSLVVERFLDTIAVFSLLAIALLHPSFPGDATVAGRPIGTFVTVLGILLAILMVGVLLLLLLPRVFVGLAGWVGRFLPERMAEPLVEGLRSFLAGFASLRSPRLLLGALAWSFGFWAWNALSFWLAFQAFGIDQGYVTALFVQGVIGLGVAIPSAPGFFGTFHAAAVVGLHEVYGVGEGATLAFAFGYHLGGFIPVTIMGLWYAGVLGMTLKDMGHAREHLDEDEGGGGVPGASRPEPAREES
jgi:glycosyltransferase 2 family protein